MTIVDHRIEGTGRSVSNRSCSVAVRQFALREGVRPDSNVPSAMSQGRGEIVARTSRRSAGCQCDGLAVNER